LALKNWSIISGPNNIFSTQRDKNKPFNRILKLQLMTTATQTDVLKKRSKIQVYFLAAHEEEDECQAIRKHLVPAIRNSKIPIEINSDFDIPAGEDKAQYKLKLLEADIVLALISSDYISDDETYERTQKVIARYNNNETILVPILVRNCLWKSTPFVNLPLLPKNFQPLNNKQFWNSEDDALMAVVEDIYEAINDFSNKESFETEPAVKIVKVVEDEFKTDSAATKRLKLAEEPEQQINGAEMGIEGESTFEEIKTEIQPEKVIVETAQPLINQPEYEHSSQNKKQKIVTPLEVDWRKLHYRNVTRKRFFAFLLDQFLTFIPLFAIGFVIASVAVVGGESAESGNSAGNVEIPVSDFQLMLVFIISFTFYCVACAVMESSKWRGTFGKRILKLQITDRNGNPVSFFRAFWRNFTKIIVAYSYAFIIPFIIQIIRFRKSKKLFHDELSSTVIGERLSS
jgi:uncharacterized RDD family membrane protein YckC